MAGHLLSQRDPLKKRGGKSALRRGSMKDPNWGRKWHRKGRG